MNLRPGRTAAVYVSARFPSSLTFLFGVVAFAAGSLGVVAESFSWYLSQEDIALMGQGTVLGLVLRFYLWESLSLGVVCVGAYLAFRGIVSEEGKADKNQIRTFLADALGSRSSLAIGAIAGVGYAVAYLLISSVLVFQPSVDFGAAYGVTSSTWSAAGCCGALGTVPALTVFVAPQSHFALQILPLDLLFAVVVPLLVGLNAAAGAHGMRNRQLRTSAGWVSSFGVLAGLFTGCPTCAGLFLASAAGGLGGTTLALALAPYQMLFVLVSIPVLVLSPLAIAYSAKRTISAACPVPGIPA